ncbi:hypothetical protein BH24ACI4_BH24ACI4_27790 [soil metagenome]
MPPAMSASLTGETYAEIVAYVFDVNGMPAGDAELPAGGRASR